MLIRNLLMLGLSIVFNLLKKRNMNVRMFPN